MRKVEDAEMVTLYGLKRCSSVKKAQEFLEQKGFPVQVYDFNEKKITKEWLIMIAMVFGFAKAISTTNSAYQALPPHQKSLVDFMVEHLPKGQYPDNILELLVEKPQLLRRPIILYRKSALIGFNQAEYEAVFNFYLEHPERE